MHLLNLLLLSVCQHVTSKEHLNGVFLNLMLGNSNKVLSAYSSKNYFSSGCSANVVCRDVGVEWSSWNPTDFLNRSYKL
jgi:hypothetical protein